MPPINEEDMDQEAMMKAAELAESGEPEGKPSIVYEEFKREVPSNDLLNEAEIAALADDGTAPDMIDDDADTLQGDVDPAPAQTTVETTQTAPVPEFMTVDWAAKLAETDAKLADLNAKLSDGEIGDDEFTTSVLALADERGDLRAGAKQAEEYAAQQEATASAQWRDAIKGFKATHAHLFDEAHFDKFNVDVQGVTGDARFAHLSFEQQLAKAAQDYALRTGNPALAAPVKATRPAATPAPQPAAKQAQAAQPTPVPTLARVPNTASVEPDGSRFAAIDARISERNVMATEAMLSRMTKAQLEEFGGSF